MILPHFDLDSIFAIALIAINLSSTIFRHSLAYSFIYSFIHSMIWSLASTIVYLFIYYFGLWRKTELKFLAAV